MTELYGIERQMAGDRAIKKQLITLCVIWVLVLAGCIVSCCVVNRDNYVPNLVVNIVLCGLAGWYTLFAVDNVLLPLQREQSMGEDSFSARKHEITGLVTSFADHPEIVHGIRCFRLCVRPDDGSEDFWCHISEARFPRDFGQGDRVSIVSYGNLVVSYKKEAEV